MKCEICNEKVGETFLKKRIGTIIKDSNGKKHEICHNCQKSFQSKEELLENIK